MHQRVWPTFPFGLCAENELTAVYVWMETYFRRNFKKERKKYSWNLKDLLNFVWNSLQNNMINLWNSFHNDAIYQKVKLNEKDWEEKIGT